MPTPEQRKVIADANVAVASITVAVFFSSLASVAAELGNGRLAVVFFALSAIGFGLALGDEARPARPSEPGEGYIKRLTDADFDLLADAVERAAGQPPKGRRPASAASLPSRVPRPAAGPWHAAPIRRSAPAAAGARRTTDRTTSAGAVRMTPSPRPPLRLPLAASPAPASVPAADDFDELVRAALDELPEFVQALLAGNLAVVVSDEGKLHNAYGMYVGVTAASADYNNRIFIYRDTLERDFGHDPEELRNEVRTTVRHEIAHHLGAREDEVRRLGL